MSHMDAISAQILLYRHPQAVSTSN